MRSLQAMNPLYISRVALPPPEGLVKAYGQVSENMEGNIGIKPHTCEQDGPNVIPREWVKALLQKDLPDA